MEGVNDYRQLALQRWPEHGASSSCSPEANSARGRGRGARNSDVDSKPGLTKLLPAEFTPNPPWADQIPSSFPATDGHKVSREIPSANPSYP